ncbi:MAG TPA: hypothetical protein VFE24_17665 [Pirellulales bacterium]|jgi:hypothetical protein|nr:hypothetical protein [Pirellulales bacterium]
MSVSMSASPFETHVSASIGSSLQWGFVSLVIGSVIFMASPVLLLFNTILAHGGRFGIPMGLAWTASMIGLTAILAVAIASLVFGILAWSRSRREQQCVALPVGSVLMNVAALISWIIAGVDLIVVLASM